MILALFLRFYDQPKAVLFSALGFGAYHVFALLLGRAPVWVAGQVVWASILGLFYGYVTLRTGSLLPAMLVHYLGNLFIYPLTAHIQNNAPIPVQVLCDDSDVRCHTSRSDVALGASLYILVVCDA